MGRELDGAAFFDASAARAYPAGDVRLRSMIDAHFDFIWRSLRRLGVAEGSVDDAAQHVWMVVARKLETIDPLHERAFLFGTALRVASDIRRSLSRRHEVLGGDELLEASPDQRVASADALLDEHRARALLDHALLTMEIDLRTVFVLFELEEMSSVEIAKLLSIPVGTVSSRLRRAREEFQRIVKRLRVRGGAR